MELGLLPLAAFVSPSLFIAGVAAAAAPILIHLLARRRFRRLRWAAIDFLITAQRRNRRRLRMEEWVLLALRCLAVGLLGALLARPFIAGAGVADVWRGSTPTERILVVDDSFSMAYQSRGGTSFARAKIVVRRLIENIRSESPDDTVTLLRATAMNEPVETGIYLDDAQTEKLLARLEALATSQKAMNPSTVVDAVAGLLERAPGIFKAAVYVISDFQRGDWVELSDAKSGADGLGLLDSLAAWARDDRGLRVVLVNVGDRDAANTAIADLSVPAGRFVAGTPTTIRATVTNHGPQAIEGIRLQAAVGGVDQVVETVRQVEARQSTTVEFEIELARAGFESIRVQLPGDALPVDDVRFLAPKVSDAVHILVVNGEPSTDTSSDEVMFLTTALKPEGEVFSGNDVVVVDETELGDHDLSESHLVILANVYRVSEPAVESLERFVRHGGGLIIALGDQVDADLYNAAFFRDGRGLLPASLTEVKHVADPVRLVIRDRLHPVVRGLIRSGDRLGLNRIAFSQFFACVPFQGEANGNDGGLADRSSNVARVLASFNDVDEHAAMVERSYGLGRVMLLTSAIDKEWNDWPDHPTYLPILMELVGHIARRSGSALESRVGEPIEFLIDPAVFAADVIVRTPAYPAEHEAGITAVPAANDRGLRVTWEQTEARGIYRFLLRRRDGGGMVRMVPVNVDSRESDLLMADEDELRRVMGDVPVEYTERIDRLGDGTDTARTELWRYLLFVTAGVLLGEHWLAWRWGRRR